MRVFLDACIDPQVSEIFVGHDVTTAFELGWHRLKDHLLLSRLQEHFDVFVTMDRGFEYEHNLQKLKFGIVIVHVSKNKVEFYRPLSLQLLEVVRAIQPGTVVHVSAETLRNDDPG